MNVVSAALTVRATPARHRLCALPLATLLLAPLAATSARASTEIPIYPFDGTNDGGQSITTPIVFNHKLYGTTSAGGQFGYGTLYSLDINSGVYHVLHAFTGGADGGTPRGGLVFIGKTLFGTTVRGGNGTACSAYFYASCGTVFQYKTNVSANPFSTLYNFLGGTDGANPFGNLIAVNGILYGTTAQGGASPNCVSLYASCGTLYSLTLGGLETVLHPFSGPTDGANPFAGVVYSGGWLYGTTTSGGTSTPACTLFGAGCGTIYRSTLSGGVFTLHAFNGTDGADPISGVIKMGGTIYGTTWFGGASNLGVFFSFANNILTVQHDFQGGGDGAHPTSGVTKHTANALGTALYGTTADGGTPGCQYVYNYDGCGTIFKFDTTFHPAIYNFVGGSPDGGNPFDETSLFSAGMYLYGTTNGGGMHGFGTIFKFLP